MPTDELRPPTPTPHLRVGHDIMPKQTIFWYLQFLYTHDTHNHHVCSGTGVNTVCKGKEIQ